MSKNKADKENPTLLVTGTVGRCSTRRRVEQLAEARRRVAAADIFPMSLDEIQAEVEAYRTERRSQTSS